jgi:hypothetical protein
VRPALVVLVALALALAGCAKPRLEYLYAHAVTGIVIDAEGHPVPGARVARVLATGGPFGLDSLYVTTTGADGRFVFEFRGIGGSDRAPTDTWHVRARAPDGAEAREVIVAPWSCAGGGRAGCPGYAADLVLRLGAD